MGALCAARVAEDLADEERDCGVIEARLADGAPLRQARSGHGGRLVDDGFSVAAAINSSTFPRSISAIEQSPLEHAALP